MLFSNKQNKKQAEKFELIKNLVGDILATTRQDAKFRLNT